MKNIPAIAFVLLIPFAFSCKSYQPNVMFKADNEDLAALRAISEDVERNYSIRKNDYLTLSVYTNAGERIVDPDFELSQDVQRNIYQERDRHRYLVQADGMVKLPIIGPIELEGLTLAEAEKTLEKAYGAYYNDPFVKLSYDNKRVIVLGAIGGQVIPLENENVNLLEALALAGGLNDQSKAYNIRLIRGDVNNPEVYLIDLSTIEGMRKANLDVMPNDIIYVEPVRRMVSESLRDITPVLSLVTSLFTLVILVRNL